MGEGLKKVARLCGGLTVKARGEEVRYDKDGRAEWVERDACPDCGGDVLVSTNPDQTLVARYCLDNRHLECYWSA